MAHTAVAPTSSSNLVRADPSWPSAVIAGAYQKDMLLSEASNRRGVVDRPGVGSNFDELSPGRGSMAGQSSIGQPPTDQRDVDLDALSAGNVLRAIGSGECLREFAPIERDHDCGAQYCTPCAVGSHRDCDIRR